MNLSMIDLNNELKTDNNAVFFFFFQNYEIITKFKQCQKGKMKIVSIRNSFNWVSCRLQVSVKRKKFMDGIN